MRRLIALCLVPTALLVPLGLLMESGVLPSSFLVLRLQVTTGALVIVFGPILATAGLTVWALGARRRRAIRRALLDEREAQAEHHRRFVRRLNHELKNPLTAIRAGLANLDGLPTAGTLANAGPSGAAASPARQSLGNIRLQVDRLSQLANDLRKLADLDLGRVERSSVDLAEIVEEAVEMARAVPDRAGKEITTRIQRHPWQLSPVQGDRDLLLLAVYNLLDNALKFSGAEAVVEVRASEDGARATVEVADGGPGIAPDDLPHVVEELFRGRGAEATEGSGLGLALVERIASLHGGELAIRSREGQGTVAALRLPLT